MATKSKAFKYRTAIGVILVLCILILSLPFSSITISGVLKTDEIRNGIAQILKNENESTEDAQKRTDALIQKYTELRNGGVSKDSDEVFQIVNEEVMYMYFGESYTEYKDKEQVIYDSDQNNIDIANEKVIKYLDQYVVSLETNSLLEQIKEYLDPSKNSDYALDLITEYDKALSKEGITDKELKDIVKKYVVKNSDENVAECQKLVSRYIEIGRVLFNTATINTTAINMIVGKDIFGNSNTKSIPYYIILALAPIVAFLAICFDNKRNIKYLITVIASILCIADIIIFIGAFLSYGSLISILLYIILIPLSVFAAIANNAEYSAGDDKKLQVSKQTIIESKRREIEYNKNLSNKKRKKKKK